MLTLVGSGFRFFFRSGGEAGGFFVFYFVNFIFIEIFSSGDFFSVLFFRRRKVVVRAFWFSSGRYFSVNVFVARTCFSRFCILYSFDFRRFKFLIYLKKEYYIKMLFLNFLLFEMYVLCVLGAGRYSFYVSFLGRGRSRLGRGDCGRSVACGVLIF